MRRSAFLPLIASLFALLTLTACGTQAGHGPITASGYLEAPRYRLSAEVPGTVAEVMVTAGQTVQAGDRLMFTDTQGTVLSFTVPQVRVEHDYARQVATGEAPPHDFVEIVFVDGYGSLDVSRNARTDASGHFGVDTSDLRLRPGGYAYLLVTDRQGNIVRLGFHITGYRTWFPVVVR